MSCGSFRSRSKLGTTWAYPTYHLSVLARLETHLAGRLVAWLPFVNCSRIREAIASARQSLRRLSPNDLKHPPG